MDIQPGTVYSLWTVMHEAERVGSNRYFLCRCRCGTEKHVYLGNLRYGRSTSCGCATEWGKAARASIVAARRERAQVTDDGRICLTCGEWQPWNRIKPDPRRLDGRGSNCTDCQRFRSIRQQYKITRAEWERLLVEQHGCCALCGDAKDSAVVRRLSIDHDHSCCGGKRACKQCIRGLLCSVCNRMLGLVETKPQLRLRFAEYLARRPFAHDAGSVNEAVHV